MCLSIVFAGTIQAQMQSAVFRCLQIIIPSLYAMMILSQLLIRTGLWRLLGRPFRKIAPRIFHMPEGCFAILLLSQLAGYPVGASMLQELANQNILSKKDAGRLSLVCFGGGPAFLLGVLGQFPNRSRYACLMLSAGFLANLLLAFFLFRKHPVQLQSKLPRQIQPMDAKLWIFCTANAGQSLLLLCGMIISFSGICGILEALPVWKRLLQLCVEIYPSIPSCIRGFLEISTVTELSLPLEWFCPILCGLLSFGGCCVLLQVRASSACVSLWKLFLTRLFAAILSGSLCKIGMQLFLPAPISEAAVSVSGFAVKPSAGSLFPSCMLLLMILMVCKMHHEICKQE